MSRRRKRVTRRKGVWTAKYLPPREQLEAWSSKHPEIDLSDEDLVKSYF